MNHPTNMLSPQTLAKPVADGARSAITSVRAGSERRLAFDADALLDRCMGNPDLAKRLLHTFLPFGATAMEDLRAAAEREDCQQLAALSHRLKGAAGNISALQIATLATGIESAARSEDCDDIPPLLLQLERAQQEFSAVADAFLKSDSADATTRRPPVKLQLRRRLR